MDRLKPVGKEFYEVKKRYLKPYSKPRYLFYPDRGFIVWRLGTGENVELLHIKTQETRKGQGRGLLYEMLEELKSSPPYHSIFGFTRVSNQRAIDFYLAMGFNVQQIEGLYQDGQAVMFWQQYGVLLEAKRIYENHLRR